jgi:pilus assembly protein CpaC
LLRAIIALTLGGALWSAVAASSGAAELDENAAFVSEGAAVRQVTVTVNKSRTVEIGRSFTRAIVGSEEYVAVLPLSAHSIYIQGKKVGTTNVSLFNDGRLVGVIDLQILLDTAGLQQKIRASTGSRDILVTSAGEQVVLSGVALNSVAADRAVQVAKSISGSNEVVNAMEVAPSQQVMLEVRFLEATRSAGEALGVNWSAINSRIGFNSGLAVTPSAQNAPSIFGTPNITTAGTLAGTGALATAAPFGTILANVLSNGSTNINVLVSALEQKGLVRSLAEPNLIVLSGDKAEFLAGGEYPVPVASTPVPGALPTVTIVFKEYGVKLIFLPTVLSRGVINLSVKPEVSELDYTNAITIAGTTIPALTKRNLETTVELRDGQSFAVAGLLQAQSRHDVSQLPWIGSVPVLGALFSSKAYQNADTDLVVIVTPRLVAPAVPGQRIASPLDDRLPSNDVDFFLNGQPEVKKVYQDYVSAGGQLTGPYGHIIADIPGPPLLAPVIVPGPPIPVTK